jgi:hypothetical protein
MLAYHNLDTGDLLIGWSKKHRLDKKFDREKGLKIALSRALAFSKSRIPAYVHKQLYRFISKAEYKFKAHAKAAEGSDMAKIIDKARSMAFVLNNQERCEHKDTITVTICKTCGKEIVCPAKVADSVQ